MLKAVVEVKAEDAIGTGFLVSDNVAAPERTFLLTNKHMIGDWNPVDRDMANFHPKLAVCLYVVAGAPEAPCAWTEIDLLDKDAKLLTAKVKPHPDGAIDVAGVEITKEMGDQGNVDRLVFDRTFFLKFDRLQAFFLGVGDPVFALGYPRGIVSLTNNYPIAKAGSVASVPGEPIRIHLTSTDRSKTVRDATIEGKVILVDGLIVPGNSGGPVVIASGMRTRLTEEGVVQFLTKEMQNYVIGIVSQVTNAGLTVVYSADYILDVLDLFVPPATPTPGGSPGTPQRE